MSASPLASASSERRPELSYLDRMLEAMGKSKRRRSGSRVKHGRPSWQQQALVEPAGPTPQVGRLSAAQVLEQIEYARLARDEAEAELAVLIDHAVGLNVGWPEIAARLGVTRQAARQHYRRRHRGSTSLPDRAA